MAETPITFDFTNGTVTRLGWQPITGMFATPIYFEGDELPGGGAAPVSPAEPAATAPDAPPAGETAPPAAPPEAIPETPPWEGKTPEELWKLNDDLRGENLRYKERYRPWEEVTDGLDQADVDFYRDFLGAVKAGDQQKLAQIAPVMRQVLDTLSPAQQAALADAAEAAAEEFDPFDPKQMDARIEARAKALLEADREAQKQEAAIQQALTDMNSRMSELAKADDQGGVGIAELADPTSPEYATVLWMVKNDADLQSIGDPMERLGKAAQKYRDRLDQRAQELLKAKSAGDPAPASPQMGAQPSGSKVPRTMDEARASGARRLDAILAGTERTVGT